MDWCIEIRSQCSHKVQNCETDVRYKYWFESEPGADYG